MSKKEINVESKRIRPGGRSAVIRSKVFEAARELHTTADKVPTLTDIARKAGIQRTTLYRRWGNGDAVLLDAVGAELQASVPIPDSGDLRVDLLLLAKATHRFHQTQEGQRLIAILYGASETFKQSFWEERYRSLSQLFAKAAESQRSGDHRRWDFYLDLLIAPWFFCLWAKGGSWSLDAAEATIEMVCTDFFRNTKPS